LTPLPDAVQGDSMSERRRPTAEPIDPPTGTGFFELPPGCCRWPLHDAVPSIWWAKFCGAECVPGLSWCPEHALRAFG
jgi:hypothetical protein